MQTKQHIHHFHIPVMGTSFTVDTPIRVARFGIASVISIGDDELCETMRAHYCQAYQLPYTPIEKFSEHYRSRRIKSYLNLVHHIVTTQISNMKTMVLGQENDLTQYFELLPDDSSVKTAYRKALELPEGPEKEAAVLALKEHVIPGSIDVNIMTKIDRNAIDKDGKPLPDEFSEAQTALQGFAESDLEGGIVFSAGFNRRLYAALEKYPDFFPDENGTIKKRVILKVSDYRSSMTQGKFLAKKGVWISEHRIESGLNCGGHAFASDGYLLGPILEEFKTMRKEIQASLFALCNDALNAKARIPFKSMPDMMITVQGGIGTASEQRFLLDYYHVDRTGWATPFLLVPEATLVDDPTRELLANAGKDDLYLSGVSPLGVPFNTVRGTESEKQKMERFESGRPGSPCPKAHLVSNTEYSKTPVCTASQFFQKRKIEELKNTLTNSETLKEAILKVVDKACLCEDLAAGALLKFGLTNKRPLKPTVCPGPNLAYFSRIMSLSEMVGHIYGRTSVLNATYRPNMFISELKMYIDYLANDIKKSLPTPTEKQVAYFKEFKQNLDNGIAYYKGLIPKLSEETQAYRDRAKAELAELALELEKVFLAHTVFFQAI